MQWRYCSLALSPHCISREMLQLHREELDWCISVSVCTYMVVYTRTQLWTCCFVQSCKPWLYIKTAKVIFLEHRWCHVCSCSSCCSMTFFTDVFVSGVKCDVFLNQEFYWYLSLDNTMPKMNFFRRGHSMEKLIINSIFWGVFFTVKPELLLLWYQIIIQGSFCLCAQPMRDSVTM